MCAGGLWSAVCSVTPSALGWSCSASPRGCCLLASRSASLQPRLNREQGKQERGQQNGWMLYICSSLSAREPRTMLGTSLALPGRVLPCFALLGKGCRLDAAPRQGELSCKPCCKQGLLPKGPATQWAGVNKHPRNSQEQPGNGHAGTQESDKDPCGSTARVRLAPRGAAMRTQPREITGGVWVCKQGRAPCLSGLAAHAEGK